MSGPLNATLRNSWPSVNHSLWGLRAEKSISPKSSSNPEKKSLISRLVQLDADTQRYQMAAVFEYNESICSR